MFLSTFIDCVALKIGRLQLDLNVIGFEDGAFGRWFGHKGGALRNGLGVLIRNQILFLSCEAVEKSAICNPEAALP
jgi:hypothetical protein